jgi:tetratricopeptide (TPR) repeat protein
MADLDQDVAETTRLARRAVDLGQDDAVALCTAGFALADVVNELEDGDDLIERALTLNPNLAMAWIFSGWVKISFGKPELAIERLTQAMRLSPQDPYYLGARAAMASGPARGRPLRSGAFMGGNGDADETRLSFGAVDRGGKCCPWRPGRGDAQSDGAGARK